MSNDMQQRIRTSFARQSMMTTLGAELIDIAPGRCRIAAPIRAGFLQQHGAGHAGVTFTLGDTAAGYAALSLLPDAQEVMTVEMKINLLAPALGHRLVALGEVLRAGRRLVVVQGRVEAEGNGSHRTIAAFQGTMIPVSPEPRSG